MLNKTPGILFGGGAMKSVGALPAWLVEHFGRGGSTAGAYEASATVFRAVDIRSSTIAGGKLCLYQKDGTKIDTHPLLDVLRNVNAEWNYSDLWRYTDAGILVYGSGYWQKVRSGRRLTELFYLNPGTITPKITTEGIVSFQQVASAAGQTPPGRVGGQVVNLFSRGDVVYFRGAYDPGSDLVGRAPLRWAINAAFGEGAAEKYLNAFFTNGAVPAFIYSTDRPMQDPEIEKAQAWHVRLFQGAANAFKTGFLGNGLRPYPVGSTIKDMELPGVRSELRRTLSIATGVPEMLFTTTDSADLTPVELAMKLFYYTTVIPGWARYSETLNAELVVEYPDLVAEDAYLGFDATDIEVLQEDATAKTARLVSLVAAGILKKTVVALELGYDEKDVPEPAPTPAPLQGGQGQGNGEYQDPGSDQAPADAQPAPQRSVANVDLERWQRKALGALAKGKPAAVTFASDAISAERHQAVSQALEMCKTEADVRRVFNAERAGGDPHIDELAALVAATHELKRLNDLAGA